MFILYIFLFVGDVFSFECKKSACFDYSSVLVENMNTNEGACDNWYEYTCGNFQYSASGNNRQSGFAAANDAKMKNIYETFIGDNADSLQAPYDGLAK